MRPAHPRLPSGSATRRALGGFTAWWLGCAAGCQLLGWRINTSGSIPVGLYRVSRAPLSSIAQGAYVMFCPPPTPLFAMARARGYLGAGFCPGGHGYLMKRVAAAPKDCVRFGADGVRVNGQLLAFSAPLRTDAAGRALPRYQAWARVLPSTEVLLMSEASRTGFDARYFGPLPVRQIDHVIVPLMTWPTAARRDAHRGGPRGVGACHGLADCNGESRHNPLKE